MTPDLGHAPVVLDIAGTALNADDRRRLKHPLTGGLILFARNWESRAQLTALTAEIKALRPDVLVCVDHEGGRVQRFRSDGFTHLPPMAALGALWMRDAMAATNAATAAGHVDDEGGMQVHVRGGQGRVRPPRSWRRSRFHRSR